MAKLRPFGATRFSHSNRRRDGGVARSGHPRRVAAQEFSHGCGYTAPVGQDALNDIPPRTRRRNREAASSLIQEISWVVLHPMGLQQTVKFFVERQLPVVFLLIADVFGDLVEL